MVRYNMFGISAIKRITNTDLLKKYFILFLSVANVPTPQDSKIGTFW